MKAMREDRVEGTTGSGRGPLKYLLLALALIALGVVLWRTMEGPATEPAPATVPVAEVAAEVDPLPSAADIPPRPAAVTTVVLEPSADPAVALPALADSDALVREQLAAAGASPPLDRLLLQQNLIQQGAALIDGFSRGLVLRKLLPIDPPAEAFSVLEQDGQVLMNPAGYARFDALVAAFTALDTAVLVDTFHTLRPLYEEAFGQLGLNPDEFDNAVIRMLDRILATPEIDGPIALTRKSVLYRYADPQLEELVPLQKQLLRMGPENIRRIKLQARVLREGLLNQ
jgi:hypothetical protein